MKRLRRIIFNVLAAISAPLFCGTVALRIWSVLAPDTHHLILDWHEIKFGCTQGLLLYEGPRTDVTTYEFVIDDRGTTTNEKTTTTVDQTVFRIRCWRVALACAILPAVWLGLWYNRRAPKEGRCPTSS